ncbi:protein Star-like [Macrosteles quadrilineatus]|uniref:protein Star-like n=1 Tax=Macrosteles quadrilineatus TaxID=74068 RepID=UPI0023E096D7|nr:protein Star-like [Macrosteles quadrilineatus]
MVEFIKTLCANFIERTCRSKASNTLIIVALTLSVIAVIEVLLMSSWQVEFVQDGISPREMRSPNHNQEDVQLVRELSSLLIPPAKKGHVNTHELPYPSKFVEELRVLTDYKQGGYFIEVGSGDKQLFSDTLFLERHMGWTGLLVEPDVINLQTFRRNAWIAPACMSLNRSAYEFHRQPYIQVSVNRRSYSPATIMCYPFYTFWLALNRPVVDLLAIDVGGGEVEILETIPFDKVDVKILHVDHTKARDGFMGVTTLLQQKGYKVVSETLPRHLFFIKKEYVNRYNAI